MVKPSFPQLVRILSWVADGLLLIFALAIFIAHGPTMGAQMAVILALCVFLGALLPLIAHYLDYLHNRLLVKAQETAAPETIKELTAHFEKLLLRVEEAAADAARTTLTARQIPGQIQTSTHELKQSQSEMTTALSGLKSLPTSASVDALAAKLNPPEPTPIDLSPLTARLEALEGEIEKALLIKEDKLEEIIDQLQQFEDALDTLSEPAVLEEEPTLDVADDSPPLVISNPQATPEPVVGDPAHAGLEHPKPASEETEPVRAPEPTPPVKKKASAKAKTTLAPNPQADLFADESDPEPTGASSTTTVLVKAMIGLQNELYARGEEPLSWTEGVALKPVGIGEWQLDLEALTAPIEIQLRLNDEMAAKGPSLKIEPGQDITVSPEFPPENEPF